MGNTSSSSSKRNSRRSSKKDDVATRAQNIVGDSVREIQAGIQSGIKRLEEQDHPAAQLLDSMCGNYLDEDRRYGGGNSFYSEDVSEDDSRTISEDETTTTDYRRRRDEDSYFESDYESATQASEQPPPKRKSKRRGGEESEEDVGKGHDGAGLQKPLASSFAKRCYFTKAGIGKTTQHYEGLTLTGNVVLMLASAMKLKGCPTICDEDLRRVEQTFPNQFSRLPDELLLSSGWRRISKYCHFSNKPIPDGVPFFHSKQRLHVSGGFYFLLAAAVGMVRPIDVEPLNRDTLVLLQTDFPAACDAAPQVLISGPEQWTLVDKFCFFSGGPINTEEDVYYQADFDGNPIYMLAFLSPSLTPSELYKLDTPYNDPGLKSAAAVEEVESVYDLTDRDFEDLKLYHLGPCRALPQYILQPQAWTKVLPPHFLAARQQAFLRAQDYERLHGFATATPMYTVGQLSNSAELNNSINTSFSGKQRVVNTSEDLAVDTSIPLDETRGSAGQVDEFGRPASTRMDPPDDEPPSLRKKSSSHGYSAGPGPSYSEDEPSFDQTFDGPARNDFSYEEHPDQEYYGDELSPMSSDQLYPGGSNDTGVSTETSGLGTGSPNKSKPPKSPTSPDDSIQSQTSAMRGAQELLKRNRQRRLEMARQKEMEEIQARSSMMESEDEKWQTSPRTDSESVTTWDSGSEMTSVVSGSSAWTDGSNNPERSSRRALILQMAKARMKNNKIGETTTIHEEVDENDEKKMDLSQTSRDNATDIDLAQDLD